MKCPKCGNEIEDGKLYCGVCGEEIRIVPDFDATVDETLNLSMTGVIDQIDGTEGDILSQTKEIKSTTVETIDLSGVDTKTEEKWVKPSKRNLAFIVTLVVLGILFIVLIYSKVNNYYSFDSLHERAFEQYEAGNYNGSIATIKRALNSQTDSGMQLLLADDYLALSKDDEALAVLYSIMEESPSDLNVIERIIGIYENRSEYNSISELIYNVNDETLYSKYDKYLKPEIEFSIPAGAYDEAKELEILGPQGSRIYYTLDGTEPTDSSSMYLEPIELDSGEYTVNAICFSEKGISGEVVSANYIVDAYIPPRPVVNIKAGKYNTPEMISVSFTQALATDDCYYTIDGDEPTVDDNKYTHPIAMYIGNHSYKFAFISEKGVPSEVFNLDASLDLICLVDMGTATNNLKAWATLNGKMTSGIDYKCEQAIVYNGTTYYIINEYENKEIIKKATDALESSDDNGSDETTVVSVQTGSHYAVDVLTGLTFKARLNESSGEYTLEPIM